MPNPIPAEAKPSDVPRRAGNQSLIRTTDGTKPLAAMPVAMAAEAHIEMPGLSGLGGEQEAQGEETPADEDDPARAETARGPANEGTSEPLGEGCGGKGACHHRAAPAEFPHEGNQEDAVAVPDAVRETHGDKGRRDDDPSAACDRTHGHRACLSTGR